MEFIVNFFEKWWELFMIYPLSGAILSILAILAFPYLQKEKRPGKKTSNILIIFVGWAISVPIVALILTVLGKLWSLIETVIPFISTFISSLYDKYEKHPILVISIVILSILAFFVWNRWWPRVFPENFVKIICILLGALILIYISSPIADLIVPSEGSSTSVVNEEKKQTSVTSDFQQDSLSQKIENQVVDIQYQLLAKNVDLVKSIDLGDTSAVSKFYTIKAKLLNTNSDIIEGRIAIQKFWQRKIEGGIKQVRLETLEAEATGNTAFEIGKFRLYSEQGQLTENGNYIAIWYKEDGHWMIHRDIWNTNTLPTEVKVE